MNRIKHILTEERKEALRLEREKKNEAYLKKKASKNKTDKALIKELHERMVQCVIDFILEKNIGDIERVDFTADELQLSSEYGCWQACTDSCLTAYEDVVENGWMVSKELIESI